MIFNIRIHEAKMPANMLRPRQERCKTSHHISATARELRVVSIKGKPDPEQWKSTTSIISRVQVCSCLEKGKLEVQQPFRERQWRVCDDRLLGNSITISVLVCDSSPRKIHQNSTGRKVFLSIPFIESRICYNMEQDISLSPPSSSSRGLKVASRSAASKAIFCATGTPLR